MPERDKKPRRGRPPLNDGLTRHQRHRATGRRVTLISTIVVTPETRDEIKPMLKALAEKHGSMQGFILWAIRKHYSELDS